MTTPDVPDLLERYFALEKEIFEAFGYVPDWRVFPLDDATEHWWWLSGEGGGDVVLFGDGDVREAIKSGMYYSNEVYTQRHLPRWVYRTDTHTMVCVDTRTDGNKFLSIFDNAKEVTDPDLVALLREHR